MPQPLPDAMVATLKTDPTAALAAIMIISNAHSELLSWAQRSLSPLPVDRDVATNETPGRKANTEVRKANGDAKRHGAKKGARANGHPAPRETAARRDEALLALMQANPHATVTEIIRMSGRPRNSATLSLERLEKAGLVEHQGRGRWVAVDPDLLESPAPKPAGWIEPLSGARVAGRCADGGVRDELDDGGI